MVNRLMNEHVETYVTARCAARKAHDRYQASRHLLNAAHRAYANSDRSSWPLLERARDMLDAAPSITDVATFRAAWFAMGVE